MKWTKTILAWSLAALLSAAATGGFLQAQQPSADGASILPGATDDSQPQLPPVGLGTVGPNTNKGPAAPPVTRPPAGAGFYRGQSVYSSAAASAFGVAEADDPETAELRQADGALARQSEQLVAQYAATEDQEQRDAVKTQLAESLEKHFSVQQQLRERELARVEARVKKLRELTQKRREAQRTIVEQRLDQLLREADGLGWTPPGNAPQGFPGASNVPSQQPGSVQFFNRTNGAPGTIIAVPAAPRR